MRGIPLSGAAAGSFISHVSMHSRAGRLASSQPALEGYRGGRTRTLDGAGRTLDGMQDARWTCPTWATAIRRWPALAGEPLPLALATGVILAAFASKYSCLRAT
jgi:hypothetical protein